MEYEKTYNKTTFSVGLRKQRLLQKLGYSKALVNGKWMLEKLIISFMQQEVLVLPRTSWLMDFCHLYYPNKIYNLLGLC